MKPADILLIIGKIAEMAAPNIRVRFLGDPGPQWVVVDIPYQFQQVAVGIHQDRFVPSPEQGAVTFC